MTPSDERIAENILVAIRDASCQVTTRIYTAGAWTVSKICIVLRVAKLLIPIILMGASGFERGEAK